MLVLVARLVRLAPAKTAVMVQQPGRMRAAVVAVDRMEARARPVLQLPRQTAVLVVKAPAVQAAVLAAR